MENPVITDFCIVVCCENIAQQLETWRNAHQELTTRHLLTRVFKNDAVEGGAACEFLVCVPPRLQLLRDVLTAHHYTEICDDRAFHAFTQYQISLLLCWVELHWR